MLMFWRLSCIIPLILVLGCSHEQPKIELPQPKVVNPPTPAAPAKPYIAPLPEVAILVSSDIPAYRRVADAITARLGERANRWYLQGSAEANTKILDEIAKSRRQQVVAIGLDAAADTKKLNNKQVIFCQVPTYEEHQLLSPKRKGVSMLPSFKESFAAWKAVSPALKQVAIITGPGLTEYVRQARVAAKTKGIAVVHREVNTDQELLMVYKNIADDVQGYWLWPDNRVLSGVVLREALTFSIRSGKQVVVFNDELLELGGLMSITTDYEDIANNVIERLEHSEGKKNIPGAAIEPLNVAHLRINPVMVKRLGLTVPVKYRKYLDAP